VDGGPRGEPHVDRVRPRLPCTASWREGATDHRPARRPRRQGFHAARAVEVQGGALPHHGSYAAPRPRRRRRLRTSRPGASPTAARSA
jgi:hypothetical protein